MRYQNCVWFGDSGNILVTQIGVKVQYKHNCTVFSSNYYYSSHIFNPILIKHDMLYHMVNAILPSRGSLKEVNLATNKSL